VHPNIRWRHQWTEVPFGRFPVALFRLLLINRGQEKMTKKRRKKKRKRREEGRKRLMGLKGKDALLKSSTCLHYAHLQYMKKFLPHEAN